MEYNELFEYKDGNLYNKVHRGYQAPIGAKVGHKDSNGYLNVKAKGNRLLVHRVIWEMHNGKIPDGMQVDHINHVRDDNRIENLQILTSKQNVGRSAKGTPLKLGNKYRISRNKKHLGVFGTKGGAMMEYNTYYLKRGYENRRT